MAIGMYQKPRGLFGIPPVAGRDVRRGPYDTPGIGDGILTTGAAPEAPKGGGTRRVIGILGDALLGLAGQQGVYGPMMAHRRAMEDQRRFAMEQAERSRQQGNEDWLMRQQWERDNPPPRVNDTVADYEFIRGKLGDEAGNTYLRNRADPPQYRQGADGQFYRIETPRAPTAPVGRLTPIEPTIQNTPAPQLGANGMPTVLTRQQYQAVVAAKGQAATDAWARRNNIQVRD